MGQDQRDSANGFQGANEGQEAIERSRKSGHYRCHQGQMGQSERNSGQTEGSQKGRSAGKSGGEGQARSDRQGQMGEGEGGGKEDAVASCKELFDGGEFVSQVSKAGEKGG
jgi:hypothetical protein